MAAQRVRDRATDTGSGERRSDDDRGRDARAVSDIPAKGWKDVLARTYRSIKVDNVPLLSAGVALYLLIALVPALIAFISVYALVSNPAEIQREIASLTEGAPSGVEELLTTQVNRIAESSAGRSFAALGIGLLGALWATSTGMRHLISAVNDAYDEGETRGFLRLRGRAILFALGAGVLFAVALFVITVVPPLVADLATPLQVVARVLVFVVLAAIFAVALALVYRYAPDRDNAEFRWVSWGAVIATLVWVAASIGFSFYVANFGTYNATYGSLGAVVILILWLVITAYAVLGGAELNAELEAQTRHDTTVGPDRPMGERGAVKADEVGPSSEQMDEETQAPR
ncbi:MAG TPA: YihY/virulence factor BrkB family protein [Acidimicrobiia bacterium]|nr:YihY/virulence factor BrkB family protein [Acidimicrobiia bacterium]